MEYIRHYVANLFSDIFKDHKKKLQPKEMADIEKETGFTENQIERLYSRFVSLDKGNYGFLTREDFMRIPELAINPIGDLIISSFFPERSNSITFPQFLHVLVHFQQIGNRNGEGLTSRMKKLRFAFNVFDQSCDGYITKDELLSVLQMMVGSFVDEKEISDVAERIMLEADADRERGLSFDKFCNALAKTDVEKKLSIKFLD
ncbi:calcineurin B homologous protein 1-like [Artemia franciscana]|uniref:EF-hand domain-containing protein n=1 Tax=Artemia franciscana TaxID=6661 RepID=A0AA88I1Y5_ARTSF|nr:hypothetical protein QYM36_006975 [Artemia franciscana]